MLWLCCRFGWLKVIETVSEHAGKSGDSDLPKSSSEPHVVHGFGAIYQELPTTFTNGAAEKFLFLVDLMAVTAEDQVVVASGLQRHPAPERLPVPGGGG